MIGQRKGGFLLPVMLVAACATLAWMVGSMIFAPESPVEIAAVKPARVKTIDGLAAELKFTMPPISDYDAILDRPIFSSTRRGTSEVAAPTIVVSRQLELKLQGTSILDTTSMLSCSPRTVASRCDCGKARITRAGPWPGSRTRWSSFAAAEPKNGWNWILSSPRPRSRRKGGAGAQRSANSNSRSGRARTANAAETI